jgi:hypothetical protein
MMRSAIFLCSLVMLTACNPTDSKDSSPLPGASATATHGDDKADDGLKSEVESIVRKFSDDPSARVSIGQVDDEIVCGVMTSRGKKIDFYVDLVDEEAMFANGPMKAAVSAAC